MKEMTTYLYYSERSLHGHDYLLAKIDPIVAAARPNRIFDLGCGNGSFANRLSKHASVTGIDISDSGVQIANRSQIRENKRQNWPSLVPVPWNESPESLEERLRG